MMHFTDAVRALTNEQKTGRPARIRFVSPVLSVLLAASRLQNGSPVRVEFLGDCQSYAQNNGLLDALDGKYSFPQPGGLQGVRYTKLTGLAGHAEVDQCNAVVNGFIEHQLNGYSPLVAEMLMKVVGELHDNVASHANGRGYSCAQIYVDCDQRRLEFAIADAGHGMLRNVRRVKPDCTSHREAVAWCMQRGNTTAVESGDPFEQWLPDDAIWNPYPASVPTRSVEDHHVGEGLWKLDELIRLVNGSLWIWSGDCQAASSGGHEGWKEGQDSWNGVAIEFEVVIPKDDPICHVDSAELEELAQRIGL